LIIEKGQLIGEEDVAKNKSYHTTVVCISQTALVFKISESDFKKMEH